MRVYYIFLIKKSVYDITKNNPEKLYKTLENIYLLDKEDMYLGYKMFDKICKCLPKNNFNKLVRDTNIENLCYSNIKNTHIINDFLNNEVTKMIIKNSHIVVKSNSIYPTLFNSIKSIPNLFVCDFVNMDYFYLKKVSYIR